MPMMVQRKENQNNKRIILNNKSLGYIDPLVNCLIYFVFGENSLEREEKLLNKKIWSAFADLSERVTVIGLL